MWRWGREGVFGLCVRVSVCVCVSVCMEKGYYSFFSSPAFLIWGYCCCLSLMYAFATQFHSSCKSSTFELEFEFERGRGSGRGREREREHHTFFSSPPWRLNPWGGACTGEETPVLAKEGQWRAYCIFAIGRSQPSHFYFGKKWWWDIDDYQPCKIKTMTYYSSICVHQRHYCSCYGCLCRRDMDSV